MNFESGRKLSLEELKQLNRSQSQVPPKPPAEPARQDRENLLAVLTALYRLESTNSSRLEHLEASVAAQEALFRALSRQVGQLPVPPGGAGAGCGPNEGGAETGWEKERAMVFSAQDQTSQTASAVHPLEQPAAGADGSAPDWGRAVGGLVQFGKALEHDAGADPVKDATTTHQHGDRKALRKEREKKIALGHKEGDHEEEPTWEQAMR